MPCRQKDTPSETAAFKSDNISEIPISISRSVRPFLGLWIGGDPFGGGPRLFVDLQMVKAACVPDH
jgi:hypothetical protein